MQKDQVKKVFKVECRCSFYCPCEEKKRRQKKKISVSHVSGELSKRDEVYNEEKIRLTPTEKESVRVCFMVPLGSHLLQNPDNGDNIKRG